MSSLTLMEDSIWASAPMRWMTSSVRSGVKINLMAHFLLRYAPMYTLEKEPEPISLELSIDMYAALYHCSMNWIRYVVYDFTEV